jgi:hypothetical protein
MAKAARGAPIHPVMFAGKLYIPTSLHAAFYEAANQARMSDAVKGLPEGRRNRAAVKVQVLQDFERYCRHGEGRPLGAVGARVRFAASRQGHYTYRDGGSERTLKLSDRSLLRIA